MTKGGMILTNDEHAVKWFKAARAKGRHPHQDILYKDELFDQIGWNMYMPPEQAARGIELFDKTPTINDDCGGSWKYKDLTEFDIFKKL